MIKIITACILITASIMADELFPMSSIKKSSIYFKVATDSQVRSGSTVIPGVGLGYRRSLNHSGVDISLNYSEGRGSSDSDKLIIWTAPKVSYLYYLSDTHPTSLYGGLGIGWGGIHKEEKKDSPEFIGIISHLTLGYELLRSSTVSSFMELNISQPAIPSFFSSNIKGVPILELSIGAGF